MSKNLKCELQWYVNELKADRLERVRLSEIKNSSMTEPATMRAINKMQQQGRYDCKERILYLNH